MTRMGLLACLLLCTALARADGLPSWISPEQHDHPRVGQVLDTASGEWVSPQDLLQRLRDEPWVLVGEKHDNPDHHALQLWLLEGLQRLRPQGALLMEMLEPAQQAAVEEARRLDPLPDDAALQAQLSWREGWDWALYGPLVRWGLRQPAQLLAANLDHDEMRGLYQAPAELSAVYDQAAREQLQQVIAESHCDRLPKERFPAMLAIQQGRDQRMAEVLAGAEQPALLLAGSFHVRKDLGLPLHWQAGPEGRPRVLILLEAGQPLPDARQADYLWLTAALPERDYCADWQ